MAGCLRCRGLGQRMRWLAASVAEDLDVRPTDYPIQTASDAEDCWRMEEVLQRWLQKRKNPVDADITPQTLNTMNKQ